ncbi:MAG: adenosine deaminase family protein [Planctomycetota bacterium]|jgi:adenosine deaminase
MKITKAFIKQIPKTDLHVHLDGSLRLNTLVDLAKRKGVYLPAYTAKELKEQIFKTEYQNLAEYLRGFAYTTAVLQEEESLERAAYELAEDSMLEGVRYIEVRFAPQLHQSRKIGIIEVLLAVNSGLEKAKKKFNADPRIKRGKEPPFEYGIIVCAMRMFDYNFSPYFNMLLDVHRYSDRRRIYAMAAQELLHAAIEAREQYGVPVVGFDLAGMEKGYPASYFKDAYDLAHRNFLKKTVHAGEDYGPESIFQAITDLHADRIGHGVHLFSSHLISNREIRDKEAYVQNLAQYIADRRITIEVCLTSNQQTNPEMRELQRHSFDKMRTAQLSLSFCTDNRLVSSTTVTDEIYKAVKAFKLTPKELHDFVIYGFKRSFHPGTYLEKRDYVHQVIDFYSDVEEGSGK